MIRHHITRKGCPRRERIAAELGSDPRQAARFRAHYYWNNSAKSALRQPIQPKAVSNDSYDDARVRRARTPFIPWKAIQEAVSSASVKVSVSDSVSVWAKTADVSSAHSGAVKDSALWQRVPDGIHRPSSLSRQRDWRLEGGRRRLADSK